MLTERDWMMRVVAEMARLIARALKLGEDSKPDDARASLEDGCRELLGMEYRVLAMLDAASAVELLGSAARTLAFAQLLDALARLEPEPARRAMQLEQLAAILEQSERRWPGHGPTAAWVEERRR